MLDDKLVNYVSSFKSPFEEEDVSQEELSYDGYMQYFRDCMIQSLGTSESTVQFSSYFDEFYSSCDEDQKHQFLLNCINRIIKHYRMSFLNSILEEKEYSDKVLLDFVEFYAYKRWLKYFPKCISYISENILNNESMLKIFINSDYNNFITKLDSCRSCNELILNYYKNCPKPDGVFTLLTTLKDDVLGNFLIQYQIKNKTGN